MLFKRLLYISKWFVVSGFVVTAVAKFATVPFNDDNNAADPIWYWFNQRQLLLNAAIVEILIVYILIFSKLNDIWKFGSLFAVLILFLSYRIAMMLLGESCSCAGSVSNNVWISYYMWGILSVGLVWSLIGMFTDNVSQ